MTMKTLMSRGSGISKLASTGAFALALVLAPVTCELQPLSLNANTALAHGGGGGGGGSGAGNGHGNSDSAHGTGEGAEGKGEQGHATDTDHRGKGSTAPSLGSLNASHASNQALAHAAPNSRVGHLAAYAAAVKAFKAAPPNSLAAKHALSQAAQALALASNKAVTPATVQAVNKNLGLKVSATTATAIAKQATVDKSSP
jgi:hypothetical protein